MDISVHSILNSSYWQDRNGLGGPLVLLLGDPRKIMKVLSRIFEGTMKYCGFQSLVELTAADNAQDLVLQHYIT